MTTAAPGRVVRVDPTLPLARQPHVGHNRWHPAIPPVLAVAAGEVFTLETIDSSDAFLTATSLPEDVLRFPLERVHPLTGPVCVVGARPGDVLRVEILDVTPRTPGISAIAPGDGLLPDLLDRPCLHVWHVAEGRARCPAIPGVAVPADPFPGTIGLAPSLADVARERAAADLPATEDGAAIPPLAAAGLRTLPPRATGGNIDVPQLAAGGVIDFPVRVPGALLSVGDLHLAQGGGEVAATAIEIGGAITLRCSIRPGPAPDAPVVLAPPRAAPAAVLTVGLPLDAAGDVVPNDLLLAARNATAGLVDWIRRERGLDAAAAYTLVSVAGDLRIAQLVNEPCPTVTCSLPLDVFVA